ncbi:hypothetical protein M3Y99_00708800 [Aphelenchoides fujianensis]|nr:hypothetical protein M3Y99_00708800 [Aphelenchoides fujianensis]
MEAAVVKRKPRIRAAVRNGLNRFCLVNEMETDKRKGAAQLVRLAAISRAHLASVCRTARGIKFQWAGWVWRVKLNLGIGAPKIEFPVNQAQMIAIIRLLGVPVHLKFFTNADWGALESIGRYVNALGVHYESDSSEFFAFVNSVAPHLNVLASSWSVLARLQPLVLQKARLYDRAEDFSELNRHKIYRLHVSLRDLQPFTAQSNQVISASIKSLSISHIRSWTYFPYDPIEAFCRRFSGLEDLHVTCEHYEEVRDLSAYFTALWAKCLEIRDRLHVSSVKRLFLTVKQECDFLGTKIDWLEKVKQVKPFHEATFTVDRSNNCVRMFLKHNEPRGPKPTFVLIKGDFWWSLCENEEMDEDSYDLSDGSS